jgi:HK97 family phage prohead protease
MSAAALFSSDTNRGDFSMRFYWPIAKVDAEQRMVWGYASTEAEDDQGETVTREALAAALDDYMRFANIREMHQPSAVGVATEAAVDDKGLYLGAKIVDNDAWQKVAEGVYKGFSIGGKVTARDSADRRLITALRLTEISVVDRPANPEAVFDCWKLSTRPATGGSMPTIAASTRAPVQIWDCGVAGHRHLAKAQAMGCIEDHEPAGATAGDDRTGDAAQASLADRGPSTAASEPGRADDTACKGLAEIGRLAQIILDLEGLHECIAIEAAMAADASPLPQRLQAIIAELRDFLAPLVAEEGVELIDCGDASPQGGLAAMVVADTLRKVRQPDLAPLAKGLAKLADELVPRLDALQKRVEEIARTPLPPQTLARGFTGISKREDGGGAITAGEDIVLALARMSDEERTLTLIKAVHANPIAPFGAPISRPEGLASR